MRRLFRRHALACAIVFVFGAPAQVAAQSIFHETFNTDPLQGCVAPPGGPGAHALTANWLRFNVDGRVPAPAVGHFNHAWEVRDDYTTDVTQCAAFSTSFHAPVGAADDWMWTPAIAVTADSAVLTWRAVAYDALFRDGYQVRIKTGAPPTLANQSGSTVIYSNAAEETVWTTRAQSLASFAGQTIHIGFRNNSDDKFLLGVDDVKVIDAAPNLAAVGPAGSSEYARATPAQTVPAKLAVKALNLGGVALTNVFATATIKRNGVMVGTPIAGGTIASLAVGATQALAFPGVHVFNGDGTWTVSYYVSADQTPAEPQLLDNTIESAPTQVGSVDFARHEGAASGVLGIGEGNGGELGSQFTLGHATFAGVRFRMATVAAATPPDLDWAGRNVVANLRLFDSVTNKPGAIIATTNAIVSTLQGGVYDVAFASGPQTLAAGTYVVTVVEPLGGPAMPLALTADRFTLGTGWVNWPTNPFGDWGNPENFGVSFARAPQVSLLAELSIFRGSFDSAAATAMMPMTEMERPRPTRNPPSTQLARREPR